MPACLNTFSIGADVAGIARNVCWGEVCKHSCNWTSNYNYKYHFHKVTFSITNYNYDYKTYVNYEKADVHIYINIYATRTDP